MNVIKQLIKDNKMEEAKSKIIELEVKLEQEQSRYQLIVLKKQIEELKNIYINNCKIYIPNIENDIKLEIKETPTIFIGNKSKFYIKNKKDEIYEQIDTIEGKIENCENIVIRNFNCKGSLLLINVINSEIECNVNQMRLINCKNVVLKIFTMTGIFLQNSTDISIMKLNNMIGNKYKIVYDFSSPFKNINYKIKD